MVVSFAIYHRFLMAFDASQSFMPSFQFELGLTVVKFIGFPIRKAMATTAIRCPLLFKLISVYIVMTVNALSLQIPKFFAHVGLISPQSGIWHNLWKHVFLPMPNQCYRDQK